MSDQTPAPKTPGNSTHDLLNDLGEEMARLNRQTERVVFWLEFLGRASILGFLAGLFASMPNLLFGAVAVLFGALYLLAIQYYASKKIR